MATQYRYFICSLLFLIACNCHEYNFKGWEFASTYLTASMNKEIEPCEDFYGFVCGNWGKAFENTTHTTSEFEKVNLRMAKLIAKAIKKIDLENPATQTFKKSMKIFYDQCKNSSDADTEVFFSNIYQQVVKYFVPNVVVEQSANSNGSLPWESQSKSEFWKLAGTIQRELGVAMLFEADVLPAQIDCQIKPTLHLRPSVSMRTVASEEDMLTLADIVSKYHNITVTEENKLKIAEAMQKFEKEFDSILMQDIGFLMYDPNRQHKSSITELQKSIPSIDWAAYFDGLLPESIKRVFLKNPVVMLDGIDFFHKISELINTHGQMASSNYGFMSVLQKYVWFFKFSTGKTYDVKNILDSKIFQEKCLDHTVRYFSSAVLRLICEEHGGDVEEWRTDMQLLKETVFSSFRFLVHSTKWLSAEEKMVLTNRINELNFYGDIPSWIMDDNMINAKSPKYERSLSLVANDVFAQKTLFQEQLKPLISGQMDDLPPNFFHNAFNLIRGTGSIRFLIGWQLPPFYTYFYPLALKYGGTGFIMGHELMHSFGTHVYAKSDYAPDPYGFKNKTLEHFVNKTHCIVPHYNGYCSDDKYKCTMLNPYCDVGGDCEIGIKTLEENTADSVAIKIAYNAYKFALKTHGSEPPVPEMTEYSEDQLFFIGFAREFCTTEKEYDVQNMFTTHSAFRARVEQPLMNFPKFAKAFNCSASSRYGKREKVCSLYGP